MLLIRFGAVDGLVWLFLPRLVEAELTVVLVPTGVWGQLEPMLIPTDVFLLKLIERCAELTELSMFDCATGLTSFAFVSIGLVLIAFTNLLTFSRSVALRWARLQFRLKRVLSTHQEVRLDIDPQRLPGSDTLLDVGQEAIGVVASELPTR